MLANFPNVGHRITGNRHKQNQNLGYQVLHVRSGDHSRAATGRCCQMRRRAPRLRFSRERLSFPGNGSEGLEAPNRQRFRLSLEVVRGRVGRQRAQARSDTPLPYSHQRQGRAPDLDVPARRASGPTWQSEDEQNQAMRT